MSRALEQAFADLILGAKLDPEDPRQVDAWLSRHGVSDPDAEAIRNDSLPRMLVYRQLVRRGLSGTIELALPRTRARLGVGLYEEYLGKFLAEVGPRTHYLRDVAGSHSGRETNASRRIWPTSDDMKPAVWRLRPCRPSRLLWNPAHSNSTTAYDSSKRFD